ncbi:MAG: RNA polymerase sigma factor [Myxococcales bacterium]|nr:RNA polymerase sigma factor [Myxococcales bacterium]
MSDRPADPNLEALMEAYCAGDRAAFEALFAATSPRVSAVLFAMSRDRALTEDLVQVVFLKIHHARDTYLRGQPVLPWFKAIARNVYIDWYRQRRRNRLRLTAEGELPEPRADFTPMADAFDRFSDEERERLQQTIDGLPPLQREALLGLKVEGLTLKQIAAATGSTVGAVKLRAHRAYEALRAALAMRPSPSARSTESESP